jgi:hypothetical protein
MLVEQTLQNQLPLQQLNQQGEHNRCHDKHFQDLINNRTHKWKQSAATPVPLHSATTIPQPQQNTQIQSSGPLHSAATSAATGNQITCSTGALSVPESSETSQTPIIRDPPCQTLRKESAKSI